MLKNPRRRYALRYLRTVDRGVSLSDLSEQIAAWENDKAVGDLSSSERKRVYVGLYQVHLPKMDEVDAVAFDKSRGTIEPAENIGQFYRYLDDPRESRNWAEVYFALTGATVVALLVTLMLESVVTVPTVSIVAGAGLAAFAGVALLQYRAEQSTGQGSTRTDGVGLPPGGTGS